MIPINELSNIDIEKIINSLRLNKYFGGVFSKDDLPQLKKNYYYIVNLDNKNGGGSHWTVFYYNYPLKSIYFDSFGFVPPDDVEKKIKPYIFNDDEIQNYENSSACGFFCIAFIKFLYNMDNKYKAFEVFKKLFSKNTEKNDQRLYQILYRNNNN